MHPSRTTGLILRLPATGAPALGLLLRLAR